jgi:hypothetical protein
MVGDGHSEGKRFRKRILAKSGFSGGDAGLRQGVESVEGAEGWPWLVGYGAEVVAGVVDRVSLEAEFR